ncbi:hypothetical protein [Corynebacterium wankanglinii]|nr:hypothetical protein [Corynebacterium wankanglinii]
MRIPKRRFTVFAGVSGSGNSSLVFDTVAPPAGRWLMRGGAPARR